jgi:hypothetical protein
LILASAGHSLVAENTTPPVPQTIPAARRLVASPHASPDRAGHHALAPADAIALYQTWLSRLQIRQRFPHPDWSITDLWIAKALLLQGLPDEQVKAVLRLASPYFPRSHADPEDYLRRTLARAVADAFGCTLPFPARQVTFRR